MRSHSSRFKSIPAAAADSGESASLTSTHAQAVPNCVIAATVASANEVLPVDAAPLTSVMGSRGIRRRPALRPLRDAGREELRGLFDLEREGGGHAVGELGFDLETDCGGGGHNKAYSPYVRLYAYLLVKHDLQLFCAVQAKSQNITRLVGGIFVCAS